MIKGSGFNSIPTRCAIMSLILMAIISGFFYHQIYLANKTTSFQFVFISALLIAPTLLIFFVARKLTSQILALKRSTEAIANGHLDYPIEIDCNCEIGDLADSFQHMVKKLNDSVTRKNMIAYTDVITNLPNRAVVNHLIKKIETDGNNYACASLFLDINGFKRINDTFGHSAGDALLAQASERIITQGLKIARNDLDTCMSIFGELCDFLPEKPLVTRYAGDEFIVILPGARTIEELQTIANQMVDAFQTPFHVNGYNMSIGLSVGIARYPEDTTNPHELIKFSDLAMYQAKRDKSLNVSIFEQSMQDKIAKQAALENDLKLAIETDEIYLHYQPKVRLSTGKLMGVEALIRWKHPKHGPIPPIDFIPIAEETGLIIPLGKRVLQLAFKQAHIWHQQGISRKIAVNIAPSQFDTDHFLEDVLDLLMEYEVPPNSIIMEITESMAMTNFEKTRDLLNRLRKLGISIAIDDFGTGFSNLSQLTRLSFDILKIDQSLVADIGKQPKSEAIIKTIISMAQALGFETVAEGIETVKQLNFLEQNGCDVLQGYLLGRPMATTDLDVWVNTADALIDRGFLSRRHNRARNRKSSKPSANIHQIRRA